MVRGIVTIGTGQQFNGNLSLHRNVNRAIDLAHATPANLFEQFELSESIGWSPDCRVEKRSRLSNRCRIRSCHGMEDIQFLIDLVS